MIVYLVWKGSYSDAEVAGVFSNKDKAERFSNEIEKTNEHSHVEEQELDNPELDNKTAKTVYSTVINITTGDIIPKSPKMSFHVYNNPLGDWINNEDYLESDISQEHANKLAVERRQQILREFTRGKVNSGSCSWIYWVRKGKENDTLRGWTPSNFSTCLREQT